MGFMDKVRGQFIDIVEFLDDTRDTIVWRFPRQGNEIKMGAQLVVREGQMAVFVDEGQIADVFSPGTYELTTENIPILSTLKGWKYGFNSPFKAEVYFVGTRQYTDMKWGTQNPFTVRDAEFGIVRLRAFGTYALRVTDPSALLQQLVGSDPDFVTGEVEEFLRQVIVEAVTTALAGAGIPMLDLAANQAEISKTLVGTLSASLAEYGIALPRFVIENISVPPEVEKALDKRSQMGIVGDLGAFTQFQAATALEDAANNPGAAGSGAGMVVGMGLGQAAAGAVAGAGQAAAAPVAPAGPPPLPGAQWYVAFDGQQAGPFAAAALPAKVAGGQLSAETLVWRDGMAAWQPAGQVPDLAGLFAATPPPLPPQA
ncbi:SPFH domain-containing protein [Nocardioides deserti]|uniref:SPFH domain-containing protein n=1 Tax=Nocardioides deserti TaxID=1588644 RepID=A0ABR6UBV5_9ACTN|nr:SPFH domain-containing protein [Nocardioides deserti]MBC2961919.1 SPFH domain-containing protein [Nocardioides deserti]GGO79683.1 antifreeze protein, type I [Nocardioides deserti]